jgi:hypothetical protein
LPRDVSSSFIKITELRETLSSAGWQRRTFGPGNQRFQQAATGIPEELDHVVKSGLTPIVGIRNFVVRMRTAVAAHQAHLLGVFPLGIQAENIAVILPIHGQDQVELL